jgi:hypothetical protein
LDLIITSQKLVEHAGWPVAAEVPEKTTDPKGDAAKNEED